MNIFGYIMVIEVPGIGWRGWNQHLGDRMVELERSAMGPWGKKT